MNITAQSVRVETGSADEEGCLILAEGKLIAVVVRLSGDHGANGGRWFLEAGFGPLAGPAHPEFDDVDSALDWVAQGLLRSKRIGFKTGPTIDRPNA